jgi:hypothetical protein
MFLIIITPLAYSEEDIVIYLQINSSVDTIEVYRGKILPFVKELEKARRTFRYAQASLMEGYYVIEVYEQLTLKKKYIIANEINVVESISGKVFSANVLLDIYKRFIPILLNNK